MNPISAGTVFMGKKGAGLEVKRKNDCLQDSGNPRESLHGNRPTRRREAPIGHDPGPGGPWQHYPPGRLEGYDGLVGKGYKKHFRVNHGQHEFARGNCHIGSGSLQFGRR